MLFKNNVSPDWSYPLGPMDALTSVIFSKDIFDQKDLELIEEASTWFKSKPGKVDEKNEVNLNVRNAEITFFKYKESLKPIYDKLAECIHYHNDLYFRFRIGFIEILQYTEYKEGCFYDWHPDCIQKNYNIFYEQRKISITIQLSDASEYEGGELEFWHPTTPRTAPKEKGTVIMFPSYYYHRVKPVTKGKRVSLVSWINGPDFC